MDVLSANTTRFVRNNNLGTKLWTHTCFGYGPMCWNTWCVGNGLGVRGKGFRTRVQASSAVLVGIHKLGR